MAEEKKGHVKVTLDVEINAALMDMLKECIENMPHMIQMMTEQMKEERIINLQSLLNGNAPEAATVGHFVKIRKTPRYTENLSSCRQD